MNVIAAVDSEWGIGYKGELLARVKEDLQNFASLTTGKIVILGSNTLDTFPGGRVLKDRKNIVLSRKTEYTPEGAIVVHSLDELFSKLEEIKRNGVKDEDIFVIGGANVYMQLLPYCDKAYITKFDASFEKDVYFPNLDELEEWSIKDESESINAIARDSKGEKFDIVFKFVEYIKR